MDTQTKTLGITVAVLAAIAIFLLGISVKNVFSTKAIPVEDPAKWKVTEIVNDVMFRAHLLTDPNGQTFLVVRDGNGTAMLPYNPIVK
jgi:hypothetical protein